MSSELIRKYHPENTGKRADTRIQKFLGDVLGLYYNYYHRLEVDLHPNSPRQGPALALMGHLSILEGAALVGDPFRERTIPVVNEPMYESPVVGWALKQWQAIPVKRDGRDISAVRTIFEAFERKRVVCLAPSGRMSKTGRLEPLHPTAVELALRASLEMPVIPVGVIGANEALPKGSWFPKPKRLILVLGAAIDLDEYNSKTPRHNQLKPAAEKIQNAIAELYPTYNRPLPGTPALLKN